VWAIQATHLGIKGVFGFAFTAGLPARKQRKGIGFGQGMV